MMASQGMNTDFQDRVALVTGGTGALGGAVTLDLLSSGARVVTTYVIETEWQSLSERAGASRERITGLRVDLTRAGEVEAAVRSVLQTHARIDFLLAIAGGFAAGSVAETPEGVWDAMLGLNLRSLISALRAIVPVMLAQNFGRIVTVSSGAILGGPGAGIAAYAVSKGAVRQLSEILAEEVKGHDIRVHSLLPGTMDTEANRRAMPQADPSKWVKTEEVAAVVHRLLSASAPSPVLVPILHPGAGS
jgi:NAD(P)-dependent dehydrogenase (short-subunit alcohol dehydrogenase family)